MHRKSSSSSSPIAAKRMTATKTSTSFSSLQSQSTTDNTDNHRSMLLGDVGNQESMVHLLNTAASSNNFSLDRMDEKTSENVIVSVRVRPLSDSELSSYQQHVWDVLPGPLGRISMNDSWRERLRKPINSVEYQYDQVFAGSDNGDIYASSGAAIVKSAMEGYNCIVFAYGQTSSGKTFTMTGTNDNPGVIPNAVDEVFQYILENQDQREFLLRVSYMEIYNETIRDLLCPENFDLKIHEDKHRGIYVSPLREDIVTTPEQVMRLIQLGEANRHTSATDYNDYSSRSHTIFQLIIESRERNPSSPALSRLNRYLPGTSTGATAVRVSSLNLIDLAGSEKASASVERRREGAFINKSLLTLATVISKLTESNPGHIPFRDSKLTRILQPALQGNARVSVICTISPALCNQEESNNTLKFAQRVKRVVTQAGKMELMDDKALLQKYRKEISELRNRLAELTGKETESTQLAAEKLRLEEELSQQQQIRSALKERIDHLTKMILTSSSFNSQVVLGSSLEYGAAAAAAAGDEKQLTLSTAAGTVAGQQQKASVTRRANRMSMIMPSTAAAISTTKNLSSESQQQLYKMIGEKDQLIDELQSKLAQSLAATDKRSATEEAASIVQGQLEAAKQRIEELEREAVHYRETIRRLEGELVQTRIIQSKTILIGTSDGKQSATPPPIDLHQPQIAEESDKILELEHRIDSMTDQIQTLTVHNRQKDQEISQLRSQLNNLPQIDTAIMRHQNLLDTPLELPAVEEMFSSDRLADSALTPNAKLLSDLLRPRSSGGSSTVSVDSRGDRQLRDLRETIKQERTKAESKIASLETEVAVAQAERTVAEMLQHYSATKSELPERKSSLSQQTDAVTNNPSDYHRFMQSLSERKSKK